MRRLLLCVLAASGCFDFDRVERLDGGSTQDATLPHDAAGPAGDLAGACISQTSWSAGAMLDADDLVSVVPNLGASSNAVWAATRDGHVYSLDGMTPTAVGTPPSSSPLGTVSRIAAVPNGAVILATTLSNVLVPVTMDGTGAYASLKPLTDQAPAAWAGIAADADNYVMATFIANGAGFLDSIARSPPMMEKSGSTEPSNVPQFVASTPIGILACGTTGFYATWSSTAAMWNSDNVELANHDCVYIAAARVSASIVRYAFVDTASEVCVTGDLHSALTCQSPGAGVFAVAIAPCNPSTLVALAPTVAYISIDGGTSWGSPMTLPGNLTAVDLAISNAGTAYAVGTGGRYAYLE